MSEIRHHLDDATLTSYAAGRLPEAFSIVVAAHVTLCDECRARLGAYEALGGATLEACDASPMRDGGLAATMARIREDGKAPISLPQGSARLPAPLGDYVGGDVDDIAWRNVGGGVRMMKLDTAGAGTVRLLYIPGGTAVPDHGHKGLELTMVLSGAYRDESDRFGPGDVEVADDEMQHRPVAEPGQPCICIAATEAPLKFRGLLPRLLGPVMGI